MRGRKKGVYALYKGEECLAIGTKEEISEELGVDMNTLNFYTTQKYKDRCNARDNKCKDGFRELIKIEDDDEGVEE
jgi:hypothetical protein